MIAVSGADVTPGVSFAPQMAFMERWRRTRRGTREKLSAVRVQRGTPTPRMKRVPRQIYQVLVTLDGVSPPVWRRLLVPGGFTLDRVHRAIQLAMGWHDCHLHSFDINGVQYGEPDPGEELSLRDELDTRFDQVAGKGSQLRYTYDYGDWWEHTVKVEAVLDADPDERYPICLEGEGECPPEGVGGPYRYAQLREALRDPRHPEYEEARDRIALASTERFLPEIATTLLRRMA
jgi:hypothetical protein